MSPSEVEAAIADLEDLGRRGKKPSHYAARHLLLALGPRLLEGTPDAGGLVERARAAGERLEPAWGAAVREELSLSCAEFARCLEPRFLSLPNYDLEYTRAARERLDHRLRAARALGVALPEREAGMLELADRVLATLLEERGGRQGSRRAPRPDGG